MSKPILCLDFDGVIHSYSSPWVRETFIPDPPVSGAFEFMLHASEHFDVQVFSTRSMTSAGIQAMKDWMLHWARVLHAANTPLVFNFIKNFIDDSAAWPTTKPPAFISLDDRVLTFEGQWPHPKELLKFKPWNKR